MRSNTRTIFRDARLRFSQSMRIAIAGCAVLVSNCVSPKDQYIDPLQAYQMASASNPNDHIKGLDALAFGANSDSYSALHYKYNLTSVASKSQYLDSRLGAVERISDPEQLHSIAVLSNYLDSAVAAFEKLGRLVKEGKADEWLLANTTNSRHMDIRLRAITELDERGLLRAYRGNGYPLVRRIIVEKLASMVRDLKNPDAITTVALYATDAHTRDVASNMLARD